MDVNGRKESQRWKSVDATTADGVAWLAVGRARPRPSGEARFEFLEGSYCRDADEVRVLALPQYSPPIRVAFVHSPGTRSRVDLAGPSMVPPGVPPHDPSEVATAGRRGPAEAVAVAGRPTSGVGTGCGRSSGTPTSRRAPSPRGRDRGPLG